MFDNLGVQCEMSNLLQEYMEVYIQRKLLEAKIDDGEISGFPIDVECTHYLSAESMNEDKWYILRYKEITLEMALEEFVTPKGLEELTFQCPQSITC